MLHFAKSNEKFTQPSVDSSIRAEQTAQDVARPHINIHVPHAFKLYPGRCYPLSDLMMKVSNWCHYMAMDCKMGIHAIQLHHPLLSCVCVTTTALSDQHCEEGKETWPVISLQHSAARRQPPIATHRLSEHIKSIIENNQQNWARNTLEILT